eukprot:GHVP01014739.1.p1 GENE.GHVP01014739.1~~GHVP01014739.1.p1  ORF type:complete len:169 (+),score=16.43 GHVP01014739.1:28-507(+)
MEVKIFSDLLNFACEDSVIPQANGFPVQEHLHHGNTGPKTTAIRCEKWKKELQTYDPVFQGIKNLEKRLTDELNRIWSSGDNRFKLRSTRVGESFPDKGLSEWTYLYFPLPNETEDHRLQWTIRILLAWQIQRIVSKSGLPTETFFLQVSKQKLPNISG